MKNINPFGWVALPSMPDVVGTARALHVVTAWPAHAVFGPHAAAARASIGTAAHPMRRTAATDASVDGGFV
jgi:hypothetical protein